MGRIAWIAVVASAAVVAGCGGERSEGADGTGGCGSAGAPVTVDELVGVFRENGISLDVNELKCERPGSTEPEATTFGRSGLDRSEEVAREQGDVICRVGRGDVYGRRKVDVVKYPNEAETYLEALNVSCSVYPYDSSSEERQVAQVRVALEALVAATPATD